MHAFQHWFFASLMAAAIFSPALLSGCQARVHVYDSYHRDFHAWSGGEARYYSRWEDDTHRDHVDFAKRDPADQQNYWDWRHGQKL